MENSERFLIIPPDAFDSDWFVVDQQPKKPNQRVAATIDDSVPGAESLAKQIKWSLEVHAETA